MLQMDESAPAKEETGAGKPAIRIIRPLLAILAMIKDVVMYRIIRKKKYPLGVAFLTESLFIVSFMLPDLPADPEALAFISVLLVRSILTTIPL